jgi:hypothetical protein
MSLQSLDKETISKILFFIIESDTSWDRSLGRENAGLAAISRNWQSAVEECTFGNITITLFTQHDLANAERILTPSRQPLVRTVTFNITLDAYDEGARWRVESAAEQQRNSEVFTAAVRGIFHLVQGWKPAYGDGLDLKIKVWSPSDINRLSPEAAEDLVQRLPFSPLRRYEASVIRFLDSADTLPVMKHVNQLEIQSPPYSYRARDLYRAVDPATASLIVSKCPELGWLGLYLVDWPRGALQERKRRRKTLATAIDRFPKQLTRLTIAYWASPPRDEKCTPPSLLDPGETEDALSLSLRHFARRPNAQSLTVWNTILGQEFFWRESQADVDEHDHEDGDIIYDSDEEYMLSECDHRHFAELADVYVHASKVTPDGRWLYQRPEGKNADQIAWEDWDVRDASDGGPADPDPELDDPAYTNKHRFRIVPVRELINPLMKDMARFMGKMYVLSDFGWGREARNDWPSQRVEYNPIYDEGGGSLGFHGWGWYEDGEELIDTGEPLVDGDVIEFMTEVLSARDPKGEVEVTVDSEDYVPYEKPDTDDGDDTAGTPHVGHG